MESVRFDKFTLLIDGIHKSISKLKVDTAPGLGIKSVHVFWLFELQRHPEGLTATELASASTVDRSLVSREISGLKRNGFIKALGEGDKRGYNSRLVLTEQGRETAERIVEIVTEVQSRVSTDITAEELAVFYSVLTRLHDNFLRLESDGL